MSLHPNVAINAGVNPPSPVSLVEVAGQGFMVAVTERGPLTPVLSLSFDEWEATFGDTEMATGFGRVAAQTYFRIGGQRLWTSRLVGPTPVTASLNLFDASGSTAPGDVSLAVTATSAGEWANGAAGGLSVEVETGGVTAGSFVLIVRLGGEEVERSAELLNSAAAVAWAATSDYIRLALGASAEDPRDAAAANLTGGADDIANVTDTEKIAALARFTRSLGPGIVFAPGFTTVAFHTALDAHGEAFDRVPYKDTANTATLATILTSAAAMRALDTARQGGMFTPWGVCPGDVVGTTRVVPYSVVAAAIRARNLANGMRIGQASAGAEFGRPGDWITGLAVNDSEDSDTTAWDDDDLDALHQAGVNVAYRDNGVIQTMGYRTLVDEDDLDQYVELNGVEMLHSLNSQVRDILRTMQFGGMDAKRQFFARIEERVIGLLKPLYLNNELYGETEAEAYRVDAGSSVNTDASIANRIAAVDYGFKSTPNAEQMVGTHIKVATEGSLT